MEYPISNLAAWLVLLLVPGLGAYRLRRILERWDSLQQLLAASSQQLQALGLKPQQVEAIHQSDWSKIEALLAWGDVAGQYIISRDDPRYPCLLNEIADPPLVLFCRGDVSLLQQPQLAIVGSRHASPNGLELAQRFAGQLVQAGLVVTSGLALGIDGASHRGALAAKGGTTAVLGSGLERVYPRRHHRLADYILECGGLLVSEFTPNAAPASAHFPQRNRIISGLSLGTLVIEATLRSGSLITARLAAEQGREVFALPGAVGHHLARGCHHLIQQGAKLVNQIDDIVSELGPLYACCQPLTKQYSSSGSIIEQTATLDPQQQKLLQCVDFAVTSIEQVVSRSGLQVSQVAVLLSTLELAGHVVALPGGYMRQLTI